MHSLETKEEREERWKAEFDKLQKLKASEGHRMGKSVSSLHHLGSETDFFKKKEQEAFSAIDFVVMKTGTTMEHAQQVMQSIIKEEGHENPRLAVKVIELERQELREGKGLTDRFHKTCDHCGNNFETLAEYSCLCKACKDLFKEPSDCSKNVGNRRRVPIPWKHKDHHGKHKNVYDHHHHLTETRKSSLDIRMWT